jgi:hypothetical protein
VGEIQHHRPVLIILAMFSRHPEALAWAKNETTRCWGPIALESDIFDFVQTTYYEARMGTNLKKQILAFENLAPPAELPHWKHQTNQWEDDYRSLDTHPEPRPLNLDPGYLTEAKLVLATTKDRDHRLYLSDGIYAEGTLYFYRGQWKTRPWTYPDYQTTEYHEFFSRCREHLRHRYGTS